MIALLFALTILAAAGLGAFAWLRPKRPTDGWEAAGASLLFGSTGVSIGLFALGPLLRGNHLVVAVTVLALAAAVCAWPLLRRAEWHAVPGSKFFAALLSCALALVAWQSFAQPLGGDGLFSFEVRARLAWENGGTMPAAFLSDSTRFWNHQCYPPLVVLNELWLYLCLGEPNQALAKVFGVVWFTACACVIFSHLARTTRDATRGCIALGLMLGVPAVTFARGGAIWVWGDFILAATAAAAALYLVEYRVYRTGLGCAAALLATLPWTKREGILLGAALLAGFAWKMARERDWRALAILSVPFASVFAGWKVFTIVTRTPPVGDFAPASMELFAQNIDRLPSIIVIAMHESIVWQRWSVLGLLAAVAFLRIARTPELARWRPLLITVVLCLTGYAAMYLFSLWPNTAVHMATSYPRLLVPPALITVVLVAAAMPLRPRIREDR